MVVKLQLVTSINIYNVYTLNFAGLSLAERRRARKRTASKAVLRWIPVFGAVEPANDDEWARVTRPGRSETGERIVD